MMMFLRNTSGDSSNTYWPSKVTKVMRQVALAATLASLGGVAAAQAGNPVTQIPTALYRQLSGVGLDASQTFAIRDASLNREEMHLTLTEGTISFTQAINGQVTGAFFEGEGEILLVPPNQTERGTLALFTKSAVLTEKFNAAYLRFSRDAMEELQPALRPAENPAGFVERWQSA